jgi:hypothetical protein
MIPMTVFLTLSLFLLFDIISFNGALAQPSSSNPTPEQLEECKQLGIRPEKCSEQAILGKYCLGPNEACNPVHVPNDHVPNDHVPNDVTINLIPVYVGIAGAFVAGIVYVKKTGKWKANFR